MEQKKNDVIPNKENEKYKNSMFVDLFYEDETATENDIALYNALHDEPLPKDVMIQRIRVDDVLYMNFKNDVSFGIKDKVLVFTEHQSTINENMVFSMILCADIWNRVRKNQLSWQYRHVSARAFWRII